MGDYHCTSLALNLHPDIIIKMLNNDTGLFLYSMRIAFHIRTQDFICSLLIEERIIIDGLNQVVVTLIRRIVFQDIKDKLLLDCLLHRIHIVRLSLFRSVLI